MHCTVRPCIKAPSERTGKAYKIRENHPRPYLGTQKPTVCKEYTQKP